MRSKQKRFRIEALEQRQLMAVVSGDFNGDGFEDVAFGNASGSRNDETSAAGFVSVQYGSGEGLQSTSRAFDQDSQGIPGAAEQGDRFGATLAVGDFNGDGYDDLAVGVPLEDTHGTDNGAVHVFYGSIVGLWPHAGSRLLTNRSGQFGAALAAGNFNGDFNPETGLPIDDLAIGIPKSGLGLDQPVIPPFIDGLDEETGVVHVFHGSVDGIGLKPDLTFAQGSDITGESEDNDYFGSALAAADFNGDGYDDLAVGAPGEDYATFGLWENKDNVGAVYIVNGSAGGLDESDSYSLERESNLQDYERFGSQLVTGDFNGDGLSDLAVLSEGNGVTFDDHTFGLVGQPDRNSALRVYYGSDGKLGEQARQTLNDDAIFGLSADLAVGDLNGDGIDDLVLGQGDSISGATSSQLFEFQGGAGLLRLVRLWTNDTPGLEADHLSEDIAAGDFNGDGIADLAVGTSLPVSSVLSFVTVGSIATPPGLGDRYGRLQVIEGTDGLGLQTAGNYLATLYGPGDGSGIVGLANPKDIGNSLANEPMFEADTAGNEWLTDPAAVEKLYFQVLGRAPDADGLQYHVDRLHDGAPLSSVAAGIFESPERLDPIIAGMYRDYLLRDAGPSEIAYYREQWQREGSPDQIKANIISSPEFYQSAGATDAGWVGELYQRLLGRAAAAAEVQYWTDRLSQGAGRKQVVFGFLQSDESYRNLALAWYQQYLNRRPTHEEIAEVVAAMQAGATQRDMQMQLIDTDEYRRVPA